MERRYYLMTTNKILNGGGSAPNVSNYLTIVALEDGLTASLSTNDVEYCVDGDGNWTTLAAGTISPVINKDHYISFRGNLTPTSSKGIGTFKISKSCDLTGNCNSLLFGDDAKTNLSLNGKNYAFYKLFYNCTTIKNVSSNFLPATTLANYCYRNMFNSCSSLITPPKLPATTLAGDCYSSMFYNCTSLITAPSLPATTLKDYCYEAMFYGCSSLITPPQLPATTLALGCYSQMFQGCSSLTTTPKSLPATTLTNYCYTSMFRGCTSLTTTPELPATTLTNYCYYYMFNGCSSLTKAPELPATTLANYCYSYMFLGCSKLNYIKALFTTTPSTSYTSSWVYRVASSGTFVKNKNATWSITGTNGIPSGWTVQTA